MKKNDWQNNLPEIEKKIGYTFKDKSLITQAFTRTSFCNEEHSRTKLQSNEVLEFFGDSVLSLAIISFLLKDCTERYEHGIRTKLTEGDFSNIKSKLSDKKNLSSCTKSLGLQKFLRVGEGDVKLGISNEPSVMEDLFESIIGAVYIDSGMNLSTVMNVVSGMLDVGVYTEKTPPIQSAKNALQEFCADKKRRLPSPVYKTASEEGPDHKKIYERAVYIGERLVATGKGKNQKLADTEAAEKALAILKSEYNAGPEIKDNDNNNLHLVNKTPNGSEKVKKNCGSAKSAVEKNSLQKKAKKQLTKAITPKESTKLSSTQAPAKTASPLEAKRIQPQSAKARGMRLLGRGTAKPTFKDRGEQNGLYVVECSYLGVSVSAKAKTRLNARNLVLAAAKKQTEKNHKK